ncbi:type I secretion system permease/ATPase [Azospirillum sp. A26]|uniref:type I secretion system permease/ATPase n=1 Tax=Azospirillum sp. A26 TaxID=3160607 RepID=UPI00366B7817
MAASTEPVDTGLISLVMMLRFHAVAATPEQIRHQTGTVHGIGVQDILRTAKACSLKAKRIDTSFARLAGIALPAIAMTRQGTFLVLAQLAEGGRVLVQDPAVGRPTLMDRDAFEAVWNGGLLLFARRASLSDLGRRFDIGWFLTAVGKYRRVLSEVLVASFFLQIFGLVSPLFFQVVTDKVLVHRGLSTLDVLVIGLTAIGLFETVLGGLRSYIFSHTTNRIDVELGARLYRHLLALPIGYFQTRSAGSSVARVRELESIRQFLTGSALTLVLDLLFTVVFLAMMFTYSAALTWVVVGSLPVYFALSAGVTPLFKRRLDEKFARGAENQAFLVESVTAVETLKAMAVEPQMQRRWEDLLSAYVGASFRVQSLGTWASQSVQFVSKLVGAATLWWGARLVIDGGLTVGELVAFNMLAGRVAQPVLRLAQLWQDFQQARVSVDRLGDILNTPAEPGYGGGRASPPPIRGDIAFEHVTFRYRLDGPEILKDLSLRVGVGQTVGIVGSSGSGKSTLTRLLQRLYVPESGRVLVDGVDLAMVDAAWLRRQVGVVLQESVLFNRSIRENIALSDPAMPLERVAEAAKLAGAHDFILGLPQSYETVVGERGAALSGGQRQRIAIARALVGNPRILILDEATSALDYESEQIVQQNMRRICQGRTVLIIAHRLSTVRHADRIVTVEQGRIVEDGTHDELLTRDGRYARLHRVQAGGFAHGG